MVEYYHPKDVGIATNSFFYILHKSYMHKLLAQSSFKEMLCGLLLGLFLGVLCLFWVRESVFTRRHQMGIMTS